MIKPEMRVAVRESSLRGHEEESWTVRSVEKMFRVFTVSKQFLLTKLMSWRKIRPEDLHFTFTFYITNTHQSQLSSSCSSFSILLHSCLFYWEVEKSMWASSSSSVVSFFSTPRDQLNLQRWIYWPKLLRGALNEAGVVKRGRGG